MTYRELKKKIGKQKLEKSDLIGYYMKLPSGWWATFRTGKTGSDYYPKNEDVVFSIFKR